MDQEKWRIQTEEAMASMEVFVPASRRQAAKHTVIVRRFFVISYFLLFRLLVHKVSS